MKPKVFYELVVAPNFAAFHDNSGDIRLAINLILTLDALFGITFTAFKKADHAEGHFPSDREFKEHHARLSDDFRAFRDAAKTIKHGELT